MDLVGGEQHREQHPVIDGANERRGPASLASPELGTFTPRIKSGPGLSHVLFDNAASLICQFPVFSFVLPQSS